MSKLWQWLLPFLIVIRIVLCSPIYDRSRYVLKDNHPIPDSWYSEGPAPSQHMINLQIGLKSDRFEELERHLYEGMPHH